LNWLKLTLYHLGFSTKDHAIFRAPVWNAELKERVNNIIKKPIYNQEYKKFGVIKDIFGPISSPFISVKTKPDQITLIQEVELSHNYYVKMA